MPGISGQRKRTPLNKESRSITNCPVQNCSIKRRADKLKKHLFELVLANENGDIVGPDSEEYLLASVEKQKHTDFYRENNLAADSSIKAVLKCRKDKQSVGNSTIGQMFQVI